MILLFFLITVENAIQAYNAGEFELAHSIALSIAVDSTDSFEMDEIRELRAYTATKVRKYEYADSLFQVVIHSEYDEIRYKAYVNYADLHYHQFRFEKRIEYLQKAYNIKPTQRVIRIIARHHFQIRADYQTAQLWIDRHPEPTALTDKAGFDLLCAEFAESQRRYDQAIEYYQKAKISAYEANLFHFEMFAAQGEYRSERLLSEEKEKKMINSITWIILGVIGYFYLKKIKLRYVRADQSKNKGSYLNR